MKDGSLVVVGTGIRTVGQLTTEAIASMRSADVLFYLVTDPVSEAVVRGLNPDRAVALRDHYGDGKSRHDTYDEMVEQIVASVRLGRRTCAAFYGHPGVFVLPSHRAVALARAEGYPARMLPAVSATDCLFADLGVDPATAGIQAYESTDFLIHPRMAEPSAALVLWQIGLLANWAYRAEAYDLSAMPLLVERLGRDYPPDHPVTLYEAAVHPGHEARIEPRSISTLGDGPIRPMATLYVPPLRAPTPDPSTWDRLAALGLAPADMVRT